MAQELEIPPNKTEEPVVEKTTYELVDIQPASDYEYLMGAINAMECMDGTDPMTKEDKQFAERIKHKSLHIIDLIINRMHDELFG